MKPSIIMLCGMPGSGKTTWAKKHSQKYGSVVVNKDDIYRFLTDNYDNQWEYYTETIDALIAEVEFYKVSHHVWKRHTIIIDNVNLSKSTYNLWKGVAEKNDYGFMVQLLDTSKDLDLLLERNKTRPELDRIKEETLLDLYEKYMKIDWVRI